MPIKATNNYIFIVRDEEKSEVNGLLLPPSGVVKPHTGTIFSVGGKVTDPNIIKSIGLTALFHQGIGFTIEDEGNKYLVLQEHEIIAIK
jgi:co-chaperonin GroES (HSP10)